MIQSSYRRREHLRLPFFDYSQYGCYFVTICTKIVSVYLAKLLMV